MGLTVRRDLIIEFDSVLQDIGVILLHEAALGHVVIGYVREPCVLPGLLKPIVSFLEVFTGIVNIAHRIPGGSRVV